MHIVPNNKLSNHYRKKKTEKHIWIDDQTASSSFRQNMETMGEKTKTGMFYEDYLNPNYFFSNNFCPDFYDSYSSMMNPYIINGVGLNNFVGGDIRGLEENNGSSVFVWKNEKGNNGIINNMVDEKDANDTNFNYVVKFVNCTNQKILILIGMVCLMIGR